MRICTADEMRRLDSRAIEEYGILGTTLMTRAGLTVCDVIETALGTVVGKRFRVFCGAGKNGGDGFVIARELSARGGMVETYLTGNRDKFADDTSVMASLYEKSGGVIRSLSTEEDIDNTPCDCMVDAIFGIGFHGALKDAALIACQYMNKTDGLTVAVDLPSGVETDSAVACQDAVCADITVTFTYPKPACCLTQGAVYCGELVVADIGIPTTDFFTKKETFIAIDETYLDSLIPIRKRVSHKGDYGKLLIVGGHGRYPGATYFTTQAAVYTGAGLVTSAVPKEIYNILASKLNEAMPYALPSKNGALTKDSILELIPLLADKTACAVGMGVSREEETSEAVRTLVDVVKIPIVLDADGINAFCGHIDKLKGKNVILTPHDGEATRLFGQAPPKDGYSRAVWLQNKAEELGVTILLKGYRTIIASPDGQLAVNTTGNPGMAKGGSGDILSGIITALLGFGLSPFDAAASGAYIHGAAGDLCAVELGEYGMTPSDMLKKIPLVLKKYTKETILK